MNKKELAGTASALLTLVSGHVLTFCCYCQHDGIIHDSVEWYFSQCLIYAGSFFGLALYTRHQINKIIEKTHETNK